MFHLIECIHQLQNFPVTGVCFNIRNIKVFTAHSLGCFHQFADGREDVGEAKGKIPYQKQSQNADESLKQPKKIDSLLSQGIFRQAGLDPVQHKGGRIASDQGDQIFLLVVYSNGFIPVSPLHKGKKGIDKVKVMREHILKRPGIMV